MKCMICSSKMLKSKEQIYHYRDCGISKIYLIGVEIQQCTNKECGEEEVIIPQLEELHSVLAQKLASKKSKLFPEEIRFLRTHLGFSGADFASYMGVSPETVSRWEKGSVNMKEASERLLRILILSRQAPFREYEKLKEFGTTEIKHPLKLTFRIDRTHWHEENVA
jgi:putative transcriptional regulator